MHAARQRCEVLCSRKGELSPDMDLRSMMPASPNAKVHGVLTMLSPMKPGKKFNAIMVFSTV